MRLAELFLVLDKRPTAIQICDDVMAAVFVVELLRRGVRIPEEVSVVGADDLPLAAYISAIPLTTVSQPVTAIAAMVVDLLFERINSVQNDAPRQVMVQGELIQRQSTTSPFSAAD